jgi:hypothetical protein
MTSILKPGSTANHRVVHLFLGLLPTPLPRLIRVPTTTVTFSSRILRRQTPSLSFTVTALVFRIATFVYDEYVMYACTYATLLSLLKARSYSDHMHVYNSIARYYELALARAMHVQRVHCRAGWDNGYSSVRENDKIPMKNTLQCSPVPRLIPFKLDK